MAAKFSVAIVIQGIDKATAPIARVQAAINRARRPFDEIGKRIKRLSDAAGLPRLAAAAGGAGRAIGNMAGELRTAGFRLATTGALVAGVTYGIARSFLNFGDEIADTSVKLGVNAERLQEWRYAAKLANVEQETLDTGIARFARLVGQAQEGSRGAREAIAKMGAGAFTATGQIKPLEQLLPMVADHLKSLKTPYERAAFAQQLFGRGGSELIPMLIDGSLGLEALGKEARSLGLIFSNDAVRAAGRMSDELDKAEMVVLSLKNTIGMALAPVVVDIARKFSAWVVKNRPEIERFARAFAESIPPAIDKCVAAFRTLMKLMRPLVALWEMVTAAIGPVPAILLAITAAILISLVPSIVSTISALYTLSAALLATPAGWVILAIAAIVAALAAMAAGILLVVSHWDQISERFPRVAALAKTVGFALLQHIVTPLMIIAKLVETTLESFERMLSIVPDWAFELVGAKLPGDSRPERTTSGSAGRSRLLQGTGAADAQTRQFQDIVNRFLASQGQANGELGAPTIGPAIGPQRQAAAAGVAPIRVDSKAAVEVDFKNVPQGLRITPKSSPGVDLDLKLGYGMIAP